jgi:hypothetical protein
MNIHVECEPIGKEPHVAIIVTEGELSTITYMTPTKAKQLAAALNVVADYVRDFRRTKHGSPARKELIAKRRGLVVL